MSDHKLHKDNVREYSGFNRLIRSKAVQIILNKVDDGTFQDFFRDWRWIFSFSKKYKRAIIFYTILGILGSTLSLVSSVSSKYMIDIITGYETSRLWLLAAIMVSSMIISLVFSSLVSRFSTKISIYVNNDIQAGIFDQMIDGDWLELSRFPKGDLLNRFNNDVSTIASNAVSWIPDIIISLYQFVSTFFVIFYYDINMAWIALSSAPILLLASRYLMRKNREYRQRVLEINSGMMSFEAETFYNMDSIKSFGIMGHYSRQLRTWQEKYRKHNLDYNLFTIKTNIATSVLTTIISFVAFGYCLYRLWHGDITYGTMTLFLTQRSKLSKQFTSLVGIVPGMLNSAVSAQRIRELIALPREKHLPEDSAALAEAAKDGFRVEMTGVSFAYTEQNQVLKEACFVAVPNQIVALVGPSGQGKTTLIRLILGITHPDEGDVSLVDKDGNRVPINADTRRYFSYVPQGNTILSGTVAENMRMVNEDATDEEIESALKMACAWEFVSKLDKGIYSKLGERGHGVSEGQAQRIAIARAVLRDAPILLLDEATSALDVKTERKVLRNIIRQQPNKTIILTTHRPSVLDLCQRVYRVMDTELTQQTAEESSRMVMDF